MSTKIIETTDYALFKNIKGNRSILPKHVVKLMSSIARKNYLAENPILVNEKMEIIDGQHRLEAAKGLGLPVYYAVIENGNLNDVQQLNSYLKAWSPLDFLNCYCQLGNKYYQEFQDFTLGYGMSVKQGLVCLFGSAVNGGQRGGRRDLYAEFREGKLTFTPEEKEKARELADFLKETKRYFTDRGYNSTFWYYALRVVMEAGLMKEVLEKSEKMLPKLSIRYSKKDYLVQIETILNWQTHKRPFRLG